jgi:ferredoxin-NADP reductase
VTAGRLTPEHIRAALGDPAAWVFFVFGPPAMVAAARADCLGLGAAAAQVRTEGFLGY